MSLVWAWEVFLKRSFNESDKGLFIFFICRNFCFGWWKFAWQSIKRLWIATLALLARNDGGLCHFELSLESEKSILLSFWALAKNPKNLRHALNLWILRQRLSMTKKSAQYDKIYRYDKKIKPTCLQIFLSFFVNFTILQEN